MLCPAAQPLCDHKHQGHRHNFSPGLSLVVTNAIGDLNKAGKPHFYCVSLSCEKKKMEFKAMVLAFKGRIVLEAED